MINEIIKNKTIKNKLPYEKIDYEKCHTNSINKRDRVMFQTKLLYEYIDDEDLLIPGRVVYFLIPYLKKALGDNYKPEPHYDELGKRPYILLGNTKNGICYISKEFGMSVLEISKNVDSLVFTDLRTNGGTIKDLLNGQMYIRDPKDGEKLAYVKGTPNNGLDDVSGANCSVLSILSANDKNCTKGNLVSSKVVDRILYGLENLEEQNIQIFDRENNSININDLDENINEWEEGIVDVYEFDNLKIVIDCAASWSNLFFTLDFKDGYILDGSYDLMNKTIAASTQDSKINFTYNLSNNRVIINNIYDSDDYLISLINDIVDCAKTSLYNNIYNVELDSLDAIPD